MKSNHKSNGSRLPTAQEIKQLTSYILQLCAKDFEPTIKWHGGELDENGVRQLPFPEYDPLVYDFFELAAQEQWCDYNYKPNEIAEKLSKENYIEESSLVELKSLLTYYVRGERFCDGHWGAMIKNGVLCRILYRLKILSNKFE
jgi:hypothetical protein